MIRCRPGSTSRVWTPPSWRPRSIACRHTWHSPPRREISTAIAVSPDYALWKVITQGGARSTEWWARIRAARTVGEALRIIGRAPLVNVESLEHRLGRRPTRRDIAAEFLARPVRAVREVSRRSDAVTVSRFTVPDHVGVVEADEAIFVARLPDGPIIRLSGTAATIWTAALQDGDGLLSIVSADRRRARHRDRRRRRRLHLRSRRTRVAGEP